MFSPTVYAEHEKETDSSAIAWRLLAENIYGESMVLARDASGLIPLQDLHQYKPVIIQAGKSNTWYFIEEIYRHFPVTSGSNPAKKPRIIPNAKCISMHLVPTS